MKMNQNRPVRSLSSQLVWLSAALMTLAIGVAVGFVVVESLAIGKIYSLGVVFNSGKEVSKNLAPREYWLLVGFYTITVAFALFITTQQLLEIAAEEKRRKENVASGKRADKR